MENNLYKVHEMIAECCLKEGRDPTEISLLAVTKGRDTSSMMNLWTAGQYMFGENRVHEAVQKKQDLPNPVELHMIGHLQRNKASKAVTVFSCIQSVDSLALAYELHKQAQKHNSVQNIMLQLHNGEAQKQGFDSEDHLIDALSVIQSLNHLQMTGLMIMAPFETSPQIKRRITGKAFTDLRLCREKVSHFFPDLSSCHLSMGMSNDFPIAIAQGSTLLRIGRLLFAMSS